MRKRLAYLSLVLIVLAIGALDFFFLTSSIALSHIVRAELDKGVGPALAYDTLTATWDGTLVLQSVTFDADASDRKIRILSADRIDIRLRQKQGDFVPESITFHDPRLTFDQRFFDLISSRPPGRPVRELLPPHALPRVIFSRGHLEVLNTEFFRSTSPQLFEILDLALVPVTGYRYFVGGRVRSPLLGAWRISGDFDIDTGAVNLVFSSDGFTVGKPLRDVLAEPIRPVWDAYAPDGPLRARVFVVSQPGTPAQFSAVVNPEGLRMQYEGFPLPLEDVRGELEFRADGFIIKQMTASRAGARIRFDGRTVGYDRDAGYEFRLEIDSLPTSDEVRNAFNPDVRAVIDTFHPSGLVDIKGRVLREFGRDKPVRYPLDCRFTGTTFRYDPFPYEMRDVEGEIHIDVPHVRVKHLAARNGESRFQISGVIDAVDSNSPAIDLAIRGRDVRMDAALKHALTDKENRELWDRFAPSGPIDIEWHVLKEKGDAEPRHSAHAMARGCRVTFSKIPLPVGDVTGEIHYSPTEIRMDHMAGRLDTGTVKLDGTVSFPPGGETLHDYEIVATGVEINERFRQSMPRPISELLNTLRVTGKVNFRLGLKMKFAGAKEEMEWNLRLELRNAVIDTAVRLHDIEGVVDMIGTVDAAGRQSAVGTLSFSTIRIKKKEIVDATAGILVEGDKVTLRNIRGTAYKGTVNGYLTIDSRTTDMAGEVQVDRMSLREFVKDSDDDWANRVLEGTVNLDIRDVAGKGNDSKSLTGRGTMTIIDGRLFEVPGIATILSPFSSTRRFDAGKFIFKIRNGKFDMRDDDCSFGFESAGGGSVYGKGYLTFPDMKYNIRVHVQMAPILGIKFFLFEIPGAIISPLLRKRLQGQIGSEEVVEDQPPPEEETEK